MVRTFFREVEMRCRTFHYPVTLINNSLSVGTPMIFFRSVSILQSTDFRYRKISSSVGDPSEVSWNNLHVIFTW